MQLHLNGTGVISQNLFELIDNRRHALRYRER
jgi:hypothetical protein